MLSGLIKKERKKEKNEDILLFIGSNFFPGCHFLSMKTGVTAVMIIETGK